MNYQTNKDFAEAQYYLKMLDDFCKTGRVIMPELPAQVDVVTALHACDTATDDAIRFALRKQARFIVLVPCCQAEVASCLRKHKNESFGKTALSK